MLLILLLGFVFPACSRTLSPSSLRKSGSDSFRIVHVAPHAPGAFTEGLVYADGVLYESTGLKEHSTLRAVDSQTGDVVRRLGIPKDYFGEGIAVWQSTLIQLTWQSRIGFVYDRFSFRLLRTFHLDGEGWGLTQDRRSLILSDGSPMLRFLDSRTFREMRRLRVTEDGVPVQNVNELEYIHGEIFANVWHTDRIIRISPQTGKVLGWLYLSTLLPSYERSSPEAVPNGIAYDPITNHLFVTGKLWPRMFEIELTPTTKGPGSKEKTHGSLVLRPR